MRILTGFILAAVLPTMGMGAEPQVPEPKFEHQTLDDGVQIGYGVAVGDVDGDGRPDVLLADKKQFAWYGNPSKSGDRWRRHVMAENLTEFDNVCIAARDINGDGKVEVAVGAQWNPGETSDEEKSGAIFYLIRPADPTQPWQPVRIEPHDPTTHRMRWLKVDETGFALAVLPLHGIGNEGGRGIPVRMQIVSPPSNLSDPKAPWQSKFINTEMHMTHNLDLWAIRHTEGAVIAGREGAQVKFPAGPPPPPFFSPGSQTAAGEVRVFRGELFTIAPMHGNRVIYQRLEPPPSKPVRTRAIDVVIDDSLSGGHALGVADLLGIGQPQVVAGWRMPDAKKKVGIKLYVPQNDGRTNWKAYVIDDNKMACEDLKIADLDGDGAPDIVASGRSTHNLVIYWNRTAVKK